MTETLIEKFHQTLPVLEEKVITFPAEYKYVSAYACNKLFITFLTNATSNEVESRYRQAFRELYTGITPLCKSEKERISSFICLLISEPNELLDSSIFVLDFFELKTSISWPEKVSGLIDQRLLDEINELIS